MLRVLGVSESQVEAVSFGEERPKAAGHDETAYSENRRSDFSYRK
jgi:peptidoglycan-associated lipoprotein